MIFRRLCLILLLPLTSSASYDDVLDIAEQFQSRKRNVQALEKKKRELMSKVYSLDKKTKKIAKSKSQMKNEEIVLNRKIGSTSQSIVLLEKKVRLMTKNLQRRLDASRKMQAMPWMYILLSAVDPIDLERTEKVMNSINESEAQLVVDYLKSMSSLKSEKKKLYTLAKEMVVLSKNIQDQEKQLKIQHQQKRTLLGRLKSQIRSEKVSVKKQRHLGIKMTSQNSELKDLKLLFATSFYEQKGKLPHPIETKVIHPYGLNRQALRDNISIMHKGNYYKASKGTSVASVAEGRVKFARGVPGMGMVMIVDHGSSYYTVFSQLDSVSRKVGDVVAQGDPLGKTGYPHHQFGMGLHFEIRHYTESENPIEWLKPSRNADKLAKQSSVDKGGT